MSEDIYLDSLLNILLFKNSIKKEEILREFKIDTTHLDECINYISTMYSGILEIKSNKNWLYVDIINEKYLNNILRMSDVKDFNDPEYRIAYLLYRLITWSDYVNINDLSEEMSVSRSTVNNDIKRARTLLKAYNSKIIGVPNKGIIIDGDEFNLRLIFIHFLYDILKSSYILNKKVQEMVFKLTDFYKLDNSKKHLLHKTIVISIERSKSGIHLEEPIPMYKNYAEDSKVFIDLVRTIEKEHNIKFSQVDIEFLSFPINTLNSSHMMNIENDYNVTQLKKIVNQMLQTIKDEFMINIDKELFFNKVKNHLLFLINRLTFHLPNNDITSKQVKTRFPLAYELARISLNYLEEYYNLYATSTDISYFAIYYALSLSETNSNKQSDLVKKIAVITNAGQGAVELIKKQIKETLSPDIRIEHFTTENIQVNRLNEFNVIFTTEYFSTSLDIPIIEINPFTNSYDLDKKIKKINPHSLIEKNKIRDEMDLLVYELTENFDYLKNTKTMIQKIYDNNQNTEDIYTRFYNKNETSSMLYENAVAFPHIVHKNSEKIILALGTKKTINKDLNLIFFLAVPEELTYNQEQILTDLYGKIFTVIFNESLISKFQKVKTVDEFISLLFEEERLT